ncbi:glycosyltransferase family 4 protein [Butyrivibrio fibrisolvens]|uniref:glycosyltransferase family 4 protein n=1 Tax=Butyrivibrio fibrisolvens TaxID=831 RepID=UPI0004255D78|nr:glycosyltransferase family 1 protein [Butyrivibrio fibrisolvens]
MRVNVDISNANMWGSGICTFENEILNRISIQNPEIDFRGCTNFRRNVERGSFERFPFKISYSYIPYKLVYNYETPICYEKMMKSNSKLNLFCTYDLPRVRYKAPTIATVHDIILQKVQSENKELIEKYDKKVRHAINVADHILTVSEATKHDLMDYYDIPEKRITVAYNGVDYLKYTKEYSFEEKRLLREKYGLPEKYFLYFGSIRKHKNLENMITAYSYLPMNIRNEIKLVITKKSSELERLCHILRITDDVIFTDYIDECDKECLYKLAYATIFVSYYEGFGLPIIESMAAGTPVITSNVSSMPEVAGNAALLVNPNDPESIAEAMKTIVEDKEEYNRLADLSVQNVKRFDWDNSAAVVSKLIKDMV